MIQDYLKTSLVFYDDIEKQHRHNDCCQETTRFDGLISPTDRFLPFQIRIPTDEWVGDINTVTLYDGTDVAVANLIADYGIRPLIELVSNCSWGDTYVWVIYNGYALTAALPEGNHYIKITDDAGHAWYSEMFQICDMILISAIGFEVLLNWENGIVGVPGWTGFGTFISGGPDITSAISDAGGGFDAALSNLIGGGTGDQYYYEINFTRIGGAFNWSMFLTDPDNLPFPVSNQITFTASGLYTGILTTTAQGPYQLLVDVGDNPIQTASFDISLRKVIPATYEGCIGLEWYNDCDFDGIIYQEKDAWYTSFNRYINRLYFQKHLESPRTETTRDEAERLGTRFVRSIVQKKYYMFKVYVPEFLYNVLQSVALYANPVRSGVTIYLDNGDIGYIEELNIASEEWTEGNCYCHLTIEFREDAVVWTNCCDNYALRDESSCS